mmetsp:Transcript_8210/g.21183  ORF Transcript_8210/g.21183 Transcript_8210/m.21183 type:complete len:215 (-) Transcript_8210:225-869(-)
MGACRDLAMLLVASAAASAAVSASAVARAPGRTLSAFSPAHVRHLSPRTPRAAVALADVISGTEQDMLHITEPAMAQLLSLKAKESAGKEMVLRMGVRSGGCSGMSYVMDMISADEIDENDLVIEYAEVRTRAHLYAHTARLRQPLSVRARRVRRRACVAWSIPSRRCSCMVFSSPTRMLSSVAALASRTRTPRVHVAVVAPSVSELASSSSTM